MYSIISIFSLLNWFFYTELFRRLNIYFQYALVRRRSVFSNSFPSRFNPSCAIRYIVHIYANGLEKMKYAVFLKKTPLPGLRRKAKAG